MNRRHFMLLVGAATLAVKAPTLVIHQPRLAWRVARKDRAALLSSGLVIQWGLATEAMTPFKNACLHSTRDSLGNWVAIGR